MWSGSGVRRQASGVRRQASGVRRQASGVRRQGSRAISRQSHVASHIAGLKTQVAGLEPSATRSLRLVTPLWIPRSPRTRLRNLRTMLGVGIEPTRAKALGILSRCVMRGSSGPFVSRQHLPPAPTPTNTHQTAGCPTTGPTTSRGETASRQATAWRPSACLTGRAGMLNPFAPRPASDHACGTYLATPVAAWWERWWWENGTETANE